MTAKELKNQTGRALQLVKSGEKILITMRGRPRALLIPALDPDQIEETGIREFERAWKDIEETLLKSEPGFDKCEDALQWSRRRT